MHPTITAQIISARTADMRRQAGREQTSRAARQARIGRSGDTPVIRRPVSPARWRLWPSTHRQAH